MDELFIQTLTIAGSDSSGGAGIQADLKTFQMRGVFGTSVLTAVTAQNTLGVSAVHPIPTDMIAAQIAAIQEDFQIRAYKIGMLGTAEIIECVAEQTAECDFGKRVLDPVMIAKGGAPLLENSAVEAMKRLLLPHTDVLTPNLSEAQVLTGIDIENRQDAERAAKILQDWGVKNVVIKGGHLADSQSEYCTDWLFTPYETIELNSKRSQRRIRMARAARFLPALLPSWQKGLAYKRRFKRQKTILPPPFRILWASGQGTGRSTIGRIGTNNAFRPIVIDCIFQTA